MAVSVSQLVVYPVKSMAGVPLSEATLGPEGFRFDRAWMVVDENDRFLTQRQHPEMALVRAVPDDEGITLTLPDGTAMYVPRLGGGTPGAGVTTDGPADSDSPVVITRSVTVWNDTVRAVDQGDEVARWLSRFLGRSVRLVALSDHHPRRLGPSYPSPPGIHVSFADSSPLHLVGEASLFDLNRRLSRPVTMDRFRPNVVVSGADAYEEDRWARIRIGEVELIVVKDCLRCQMVNVDQKGGVKEIDPLETLGTYRSAPKGIRFGQKVVHSGYGTVRVGDTVDVLERKG